MSPRTHPVESNQSGQAVIATVTADKADTRTLAYPQSRLPAETALDHSTTPPAPGTRIGKYRLVEKLGEGVSSYVFRASDITRSRSVAVKLLDWGKVYDRTAAMKQFRTEAVSLARLKHPRVIQLVDFGFDPRWPFLVTEYFEGRPLGELLRGGDALPPAWALHLATQMVEALGAVWKAGLVHRDVKSDNILVGPSGQAKLIDFGLATSETLRVNREDAGPELAGTAAYLAPEQAKDARVVDHRADIYSLGVTLYEALTGRLPFDARNRLQMIYMHLSKPPVPPANVVPGIPTLLSDLCLWLLAKDPADRPQDYRELRLAFRTVAGSIK